MNNALLPTALPARGPLQTAALLRQCAAGASRCAHAPRSPACERQRRLEPGAALTLHRMKAQRLRVHAGRLWITEPGDLDDHFVGPGESYLVRNDGPVVLQCDSEVAAHWSV